MMMMMMMMMMIIAWVYMFNARLARMTLNCRISMRDKQQLEFLSSTLTMLQDAPSQLDTQYFMDSDQKNTSDPVRKQIDTPWDAWYSFSGSTYPKVSCTCIRLTDRLINVFYGASTAKGH